MGKDFIKNMVETRVVDFVKDLRGKCEAHVSETFIVSFLVYHFVQIHKQNPSSPETIIAYSSAIILFRDVLEKGCQIDFDGDQAAHNFASRFSERPIYM